MVQQRCRQPALQQYCSAIDAPPYNAPALHSNARQSISSQCSHPSALHHLHQLWLDGCSQSTLIPHAHPHHHQQQQMQRSEVAAEHKVWNMDDAAHIPL